MNAATLTGTAAVPAIIGIVQAAKSAGMPSGWGALLSLALGLVAGVTATILTTSPATAPNWPAAAALGIAWGLAASGLYEGSRHAARSLTPTLTLPPKP